MKKKDKLNSIPDYDTVVKIFPQKRKSFVRFDEVDLFKVVHNIQYFYWMERERTDYFKTLNLYDTSKTFLTEFPVMVVHAELDYFNSLYFEENYEIFTRIIKVGTSSVTFENLIFNDKKLLIAAGRAILVHFDPKTMTSEPIPQEYVQKIIDLEPNVTVAQ